MVADSLVAATTIVRLFFQAEDGIRDGTVTGVQTCALPIYAQGQHLREERGDLAWREVHHGEHQLAQEIALRVMLRDLRARRLDAELAEVDAQLVGGLLRPGEVVDLHDPPHADVDLREIVPGDHVSSLVASAPRRRAAPSPPQPTEPQSPAPF